MDPMSSAASAIALVQLIYRAGSNPLQRLIFYTENYGPTGILMSLFGNSAVWKMQFEVLVSEDPQTALDFKNARQNESDTVAIASSILAQIAITSFSLSNVSRAHWTARGFITFSLVASVVSVYYASAQQKQLSRLLNPEDIKIWIRRNERTPNSWQTHFGGFPSAATVLTVSAPNALLSLAVHAFLIGFGIYLGFVWTESLDQSSTPSDNRAIFVTYIVGVSVCYSLYALSNIAASGESDEKVLLGKLLQKAHARPTTDDTPSNPVNASDKEPCFQNYSYEIQHIFRESAQLKRDLATLDDRIAQLLGNVGHLNDRTDDA